MKHNLLTFATSVGVSLLLALPCAQAAQNLPGHVPHALTQLKLRSVARISATNRLDLVIGLPLRNRQLLTNLIEQIYDPASTNYHQFLTPQQFTETFGPSDQDYRTLISFVKANHLTLTGTHSNRTLLDVRGAAADIERAFHVTLNVYDHPMEKRTFFAPDTDPSLDTEVPVLHITGLDNYFVPHPNLVTVPLDSETVPSPNAGSGTNGTYMGYDFRHAYAPGVSLTGAGQVVGLLEFDGYDPNDITRYETQAGLPTVPLQNVRLDGFNGSPGTNNDEVCLDIEMAIAMAPGLSKVVVYEVPNVSTPYWLDILNEMIFPTQGQPLAKQLSCSWTLAQNASADQAYSQLMVQGQSFFQSSGDWGAYYHGIPQHSDSPYVTIVGGTTLSTGTGAAWQGETTWNDGYDATSHHFLASGGGISETYSLPPWQLGVANQFNVGSSTMRNVPDVSMVASGIWITYNSGGQRTAGGTSAAAPLWAGFMALVNQQAAANSEPSAGFINPAIYAIGAGPNYSSAFHDVGNYSNNGNDQAVFWAAPGYDLCTGWGTPNGSGLINLLAPPSPYIDSVSPSLLLTSSSTQALYMYGSGFTSDCTLLFNGTTASDPLRLHFKGGSEIDYDIIVQSAGTWSVQVVKGIQRSNSKTFTVSNSPPTTGTLVVNLSPDGIGAQWQVDGTGYNNSGYAVGYLTPGQHQVTFKPVSGYTAPATLAVNISAGQQTTTNGTYTPIAPTTYALTLNAVNGSITPSPSGWNGSAYVYNSGSVVQLTAYANSGYHFTGWSGDLTGSISPTNLTMNSSKTITANFASGDPNLATVTVTIKPDAATNAGVKWSVTGDSQLRASGTSLSEEVGSGYTTYLPITLNLVARWLGTNGITSFYVPITAGTVTNVTLTCVSNTTPGLLTVTLSPPDAVNAGAHWHVNGGTYGQGASVSLTPGNYTVSFDSVSGWTAPASQPVTMQPSQTIVLSGNYMPPAGQPAIISIAPPIGPNTGGTLMTIHGANFSATTNVVIGGQSGSNIAVSATQITCLTPPSTTNGSVPVVVQTTGGSATNSNGFAYGLAHGNKLNSVSAIGGSCYGVFVQGSYAYVGEGRNLVVINTSTSLEVGRVTLPGIVFDIQLLNQRAYVADYDGGLQVVDVSVPAAPKIAGFYSPTNNTATVGISIYGGRAYVADEDAGLEIFNLANPTTPTLLSSTNIGSCVAVLVKASSNGVFAYVGVNGNSLHIVDVSNPNAPVARGQTPMGSGVFALSLSGNDIFGVAAYGDWTIHMVDISNPDAPVDSTLATGDSGSGAYVVAAVANNYLYAESINWRVKRSPLARAVQAASLSFA